MKCGRAGRRRSAKIRAVAESSSGPGPCKYLYANANPIRFSDPSGHLSLGELAVVTGIIGGMANCFATICTPSFLRHSNADRTIDLLAAFGAGFVGGVASVYLGGPLGSLVGRFWMQTCLTPFLQGAVSGALSAFTQQIVQEMFSFITNPDGFSFVDASGRTVAATFAGFAFGGIFVKFSSLVGAEGFTEIQRGVTVLRLELQSNGLNMRNVVVGGITGGTGGNVFANNIIEWWNL